MLHEALHAASDVVVRQKIQHAQRPGCSQAPFLVCLECILDQVVHYIRSPCPVLPIVGATT